MTSVSVFNDVQFSHARRAIGAGVVAPGAGLLEERGAVLCERGGGEKEQADSPRYKHGVYTIGFAEAIS